MPAQTESFVYLCETFVTLRDPIICEKKEHKGTKVSQRTRRNTKNISLLVANETNSITLITLHYRRNLHPRIKSGILEFTISIVCATAKTTLSAQLI